MNKKLLLAVGVIFSISYANAQISPQSANQQLSEQAKQKIANGKINLKSLLENSSNDLIIEFESSQSQYSSPKEIRDYFISQKYSVKRNLQKGSGLQLLRDYNALPLSFYRVQSRDVLVQLLNDPVIPPKNNRI